MRSFFCLSSSPNLPDAVGNLLHQPFGGRRGAAYSDRLGTREPCRVDLGGLLDRMCPGVRPAAHLREHLAVRRLAPARPGWSTSSSSSSRPSSSAPAHVRCWTGRWRAWPRRRNWRSATSAPWAMTGGLPPYPSADVAGGRDFVLKRRAAMRVAATFSGRGEIPHRR